MFRTSAASRIIGSSTIAPADVGIDSVGMLYPTRSSESNSANASPRLRRSPASSSSSRLHVGDAGRHELVERDRVAEALGHGLGDRPPDEHLLAGDATEVGGGVGVPLAVLVQVLEVPGAHEVARLLAVEDLALGLPARRGRCWRSRTGASNHSGTPPTASTSFSKPTKSTST